MGMLAFIISNPRLALSGLLMAAALAFSAFVWHQGIVIRELRESLSTAEKTAIANAAAVKQIQAQAVQDMKLIVADRDKVVKRLNNLAKIRKDIADAPASDDGLVAPVLSRVLIGMQPHDPAH